MATSPDLLLHEAVLLLALRDDAGTAPLNVPVQTALGAALVGELLLRGRVSIEKTRFGQMLLTRSAQQTGDAALDALAERIRLAKRRASLGTWISRAGATRGLRESLSRRLCMRGVLRIDEQRMLVLFKRTVYPQVNPRPERELIERLRAVALGEAAADGYAATLLGIARHASLLGVVLDKAEQKAAKKRIAGIVGGVPEAKLVDDAVRTALQSAAVAATIASS